MTFEGLLLEVGGFGRFQALMVPFLGLGRTIAPFHFLLNNFLAVVPPHRCALSSQGEFGNLTEEELLLISIPREPDGTFSSCKMYREPQWHLLQNYTWGPPNISTCRRPNDSTWRRANDWLVKRPNNSTWGPPNISTWEPSNTSSLLGCQHGWAYDHSQFTSTIATEWDLVCEQKWLSKASSTFFFIGVTVGAILIGYLSDRYGRRTMLLVSFVFVFVFGMVAAASINYPMFIVFRSLSGFFLSGLSVIALALGAEWVDIKHRALAGSLISLCWSIGTILLSLVAYLIRDWRWLLVAVTSPCILGIISMWWLPESARWLLTKGKVKEAHTLLVRCSSVNGQALLSPRISIEVLSRMAEDENTHTNYSYLDMFKTPVLRKISICAAVVWFGVAFSYYGISLNITGFELDIYMTQFLYGAIELPFKLGVYFLMNKSGRRHSLAGTLLLSGFFIGVNTVIPVSLGALRTTIAILAKGLSEAAFTAVDLHTTELYPTVLRQSGLGYNTFLARIGVSLAPMVLLLDEVWKVLPQVIFASAAILSGLVTFAFPETLNVRLPETIKDVEGIRNLKPKQPNRDPKGDLCMDGQVLMTV